jgi:hypothetical protein
MPEAIEPFAALLQPLDDMPVRAARGDLEDSVRIPGVYCAHSRSKFAELPMADRLGALTGETTDDEQAKRIGDGL